MLNVLYSRKDATMSIATDAVCAVLQSILCYDSKPLGLLTTLKGFAAMKRLGLLLMFLFFAAPHAFAAPKLTAERLNYDFGTIFQGEKVQQIFRFRNDGDELLTVGNVRSSCGCTAAILSASRIAPGSFGELRVTFDSARFKGAIHKMVSIDSNDPEQPELTFAISGNVKAELVMQPERIKWGRVRGGTVLTKTIIVENHGKAVVHLSAPTTTVAGVSAELSGEQLAPGETLELHVKVTYPEGKKRLRGYVLIATDYQPVPQLRISFSARLGE